MKKRGFTLIELLAVIVILAIIALIATPRIMNVIENTKEASYDRSVEGVLHSAEIFAMDMKVTEDLELDKNIYDKIVNQISGDRPEEGQVYVNKKGEIALSLRYEDYCYTKSYGEKSYYKEKTDETCITPHYYLKRANYSTEDINFLDGPIKKSQISKIITVASNIVPEGVDYSWDVTAPYRENGQERVATGKVMAWAIKTGSKNSDGNDLYEVYIGQEGGVKANEHSSTLFMYLINATEMDLSKMDTSNVTGMSSMFNNCSSLTKLNLSNFDTSKVTGMDFMFYQCSSLKSLNISSFDTSNVTQMDRMFMYCSNLTKLDLRNFDTNKVTKMNWMFTGCNNLIELDINSFNTSKVTDMGMMFASCSSLTELDLNHFNTTNVTDMSGMFESCTSLQTLKIDNFNTSNVTSMGAMFKSCKQLTSLNVSIFKTLKVENMSQMFSGCESLTELNVSNFDTSNVTNMWYMFMGSENLKSLDLRSFNTSKVTDMGNMFYYCYDLSEVLVSDKWTTENAITDGMFKECGVNQVTYE